MPRLYTYLVFLLSLVCLTDTASAAGISCGGKSDAGVSCQRGGTLAHGRREHAEPFVWDCIAAEAPVGCAQLGWDASKSPVRPPALRGGCKPHAFDGLGTRGRVRAVVFGPVSSDFYVVAYRKIVV